MPTIEEPIECSFGVSDNGDMLHIILKPRSFENNVLCRNNSGGYRMAVLIDDEVRELCSRCSRFVKVEESFNGIEVTGDTVEVVDSDAYMLNHYRQ